MASAGSGAEERSSRGDGGVTPPPGDKVPAVGVLVVALALVVGCALGQPVAAPPDPASVATDGTGGQIELSAFGDPEETAVFHAIIDGYGRANGRVSVSLNVVPNQNEFMTRLSAAFAAGKPPDVFLVNYRRYAQFAARNALEPLGPYLGRSSTLKSEQFFEMPMKAFTWNGQLQCIPQNQSSLVVYYNRDLFAKYNVPPPAAGWAWSDFLNAARGLTIDEDGDGEAEVHGLVAEPTIIRAAPFIWQRGGRLVDDEDRPSRITLDHPRTVEALDFFVRLSEAHRVTPNEVGYKAEEPDSRFMSGKAAMILHSRRAVPEFRTITGFTWDVAAPPSDVEAATTLHSDAYCVAAASPNKAAAWDFVEYAIGVEGQQIAARLGRTVPSLKDVANSPAFLDPGQPPASSQVFLDLAPGLRLLPVLPEWPAMERAINEELEMAFFGLKTLDEAIDTANRKANEQFGR